MEIYQLSNKGKMLAHSVRPPATPEWRVIYFLKRAGAATGDRIRQYVPDASPTTIARLRMKGIIEDTTAVGI